MMRTLKCRKFLRWAFNKHPLTIRRMNFYLLNNELEKRIYQWACETSEVHATSTHCFRYTIQCLSLSWPFSISKMKMKSQQTKMCQVHNQRITNSQQMIKIPSRKRRRSLGNNLSENWRNCLLRWRLETRSMLILQVFWTLLLMILARECGLEKRKTSENLMKCFLRVSQMLLKWRNTFQKVKTNLAMADRTLCYWTMNLSKTTQTITSSCKEKAVLCQKTRKRIALWLKKISQHSVKRKKAPKKS